MSQYKAVDSDFIPTSFSEESLSVDNFMIIKDFCGHDTLISTNEGYKCAKCGKKAGVFFTENYP